MSRRALARIRDRVRALDYDLTTHAYEEMVEDGLDYYDVEQAILTGRIERTEKDDPRGTKYFIVGTAVDGTTRVTTVGRFTETGIYLIVTVYSLD